jgi:hypothetical protein
VREQLPLRNTLNMVPSIQSGRVSTEMASRHSCSF